MEKYTIIKEGNSTKITIHDKELGIKVKTFFEELNKRKKELHTKIREKYLENR